MGEPLAIVSVSGGKNSTAILNTVWSWPDENRCNRVRTMKDGISTRTLVWISVILLLLLCGLKCEVHIDSRPSPAPTPPSQSDG
jgi:hypothetical protein